LGFQGGCFSSFVVSKEILQLASHIWPLFLLGRAALGSSPAGTPHSGLLCAQGSSVCVRDEGRMEVPSLPRNWNTPLTPPSAATKPSAPQMRSSPQLTFKPSAFQVYNWAFSEAEDSPELATCSVVSKSTVASSLKSKDPLREPVPRRHGLQARSPAGSQARRWLLSL